ncbi:uncharacterized protein LOC123700480 [Colias croceus]|uniref:uncharacterized protein LOC123700480 n=1 Tax=Colias crocea TaxID=72248 RepID=UPI001E27B9D3|nr:uncharacterized protein LOC123700480 [Colias croceus]
MNPSLNIGANKLKNVKHYNFFPPSRSLKPNNMVITKVNSVDTNEMNDINKTTKLRRKRAIYTKTEGQERDKPIGFLSPRDEVFYKNVYQQNINAAHLEEQENVNYRSHNTSRMYFDFEAILERNLAKAWPNRLQHPMHPANRRLNAQDSDAPKTYNVEQFEDNTFLLKSMIPVLTNWTTCEEFGVKASFHPDDIVNINWIPFYMWSVSGPSAAIVHTFTYPTKKLVQQYKANYSSHVRNIGWNQPKLLMTNDMEMLLIAGDRKGLFYGIPRNEIPDSVKESNATMPTVKLRLKIVDSYLAMMYCEELYTVIMSILGEEPETVEDRMDAAAILKYRGSGKPVFRDVATEVIKKSLRDKKAQEENPDKMIRVEMQRFDPDSLITRF